MATEYPERHELLEEVRALRRELADSHPPSATDGRVRYQSVVDNVIDGIITIDEGGKIESFNPLPHESSATTAVDFREDLFYRINTFPIHLPPLRERRDDIALLADHYLQVYAKKNGMDVAEISPEAMDLLMGYEWRGNVRELQNVIERALVLATDNVVQPGDLPPSVKTSEGTHSSDHPEFYLDLPFKDAKEHLIEDFEKRYIVEVLKTFGGNISRSTDHSGIDRRSLHRLLSKYHIDAHQVASDESE